MKRLAPAGIALGLLVSMISFLAPASASAAEPNPCRVVNESVAALGTQQTIHGTLCVPAHRTNDAVFLLIPGATYNSTYWDFPYQSETYSFSQAMNRAGTATLTIDRLGTGGSSKPLGALVTASVQASIVHQLVSRLHSGSPTLPAFGRVVLGGHSLGSLISVLEAATYHDVNAVMLTGFSNRLNLIGLTGFAATFSPAPLDPVLAGKGYNLADFTTRPGTRAALFDAPGDFDPALAGVDEATKDAFNLGEPVDSVAISAYLGYSRQINVPVLLVDGQQDGLFCGGLLGTDCSSSAALHNSEAPYFSPSANLDTYVLPGAGHCINLARNTTTYQAVAANWLAKPGIGS